MKLAQALLDIHIFFYPSTESEANQSTSTIRPWRCLKAGDHFKIIYYTN